MSGPRSPALFVGCTREPGLLWAWMAVARMREPAALEIRPRLRMGLLLKGAGVSSVSPILRRRRWAVGRVLVRVRLLPRRRRRRRRRPRRHRHRRRLPWGAVVLARVAALVAADAALGGEGPARTPPELTSDRRSIIDRRSDL